MAITAAMVAGLIFFPLIIFPSLVPRITMPVGSFEPSPFRLNDVLGNVWEWTKPCIKFGGKDLCAVGGGSWDNHEDWKVQWDYTFPLVDCAYTTVGFRVARNLSNKERQKVSECSEDDGCRETCLKDSNYDKCDKNLVESYCPGGLDCPEMVFIPEGEFPSGASAKNRIKKGPLVIGKNEVTFGEWDACVKGNGCRHVSDENWGRGERPVINVTVRDAEQYLEWLSKATDRPTDSKYRLPDEEEWKYAARGGKTTPRWWGEEIRAYKANCGACGLKVSQFMDWIWTSILHLGAYQPKDDEPTCHSNLSSK